MGIDLVNSSMIGMHIDHYATFAQYMLSVNLVVPLVLNYSAFLVKVSSYSIII